MKMTNSDTKTCKVGDRVECNVERGTVKYAGSIEGKPSLWLGIDWDNPERGKHNGTVNGTQYFVARHETSGSFVRPEKVNFGTSALSSVLSRYGTAEDEATARIHEQQMLRMQQNMNAPFFEMVGFEKVFSKQSDLGALRIVNLRQQNVCCSGSVAQLAETCPNIEELDLSKNLLNSWTDVFEICQSLKHLFWLNVSENLMSIPDNYATYNCPNVKTLICGSMELTWEDVLRITTVFTGVEELRIPNNKITRLSSVGETWKAVTILDMDGNLLEEWSEICKLKNATSLENLVLEKVGLKSIQFEGSEPKVSIFVNLRKMCITDNLIREWFSIGELNRLQSLENLKITKNPILQEENPATAAQLIIAKIENLKVLNGGEIEPGERRGAEYDYVKKYGLEWLHVKNTEKREEFLRLHNRYLSIIERYGEPEESELIVKPKILKSSLMTLKIIHGDKVVTKRLPPTLSIQKLSILVQKVFGLGEPPRLVYISKTYSDIEIQLDDELKEIGLYAMQDGDEIKVTP